MSTPTRLESRERLAKRIREARRARRLSQVDLATAAGVGRGVVQKIEAGRGTVTLDSALRILTALSLDLSLSERRSEPAAASDPR